MGKLTAIIEPTTDRLQKSRGEGLFATGCVKWVRKNGTVISASVMDGYRRFVEVDTHRDSREDYYCNCDVYAESDEPCAHIYAALLAAEKQYPKLAGPVAEKPKAFAWKNQLAAVRNPAEVPSTAYDYSAGRTVKGEVVYIIDRDQTASKRLPSIVLGARERKLNGEWGKVKLLRENLNAAGLPDSRDRLLVALLQGGARESYGYYAYGGQGMVLPKGLWDLAFPEMSATGRLFLRDSHSDEDYKPLEWDNGPAWEFFLTARPDPETKSYLLSGEFRRGEEKMAVKSPALLLSDGLIFTKDKIARLDDHDGFNWITLFRKTPVIPVPMKDRETLLKEIFQVRGLPPLDFPEELKVEEVEFAPKPTLKVRAAKGNEWPQDKLRATILFDYEGKVIPYGEEGTTGLYDAAARRLVRRDQSAEEIYAEQIRCVAFKEEEVWNSPAPLFLLTAKKFPQIVSMLVKEGWHVEADGKLYRTAGQIDIKVNSGIDWFDLEGKVDFAGQSVSLPRLLAALRKGENTIVLDDGTLGMLPEEWLKKYAPIAGLGKEEGDQIRFTKSQAGFLDALLASQPQATWDEAFDKTRKAIRSFEGVVPADPPESFRGELRPYQRDGLGWFDFLRTFGFGGCLADDMGLGKTVQVLALMEARRLEHNGTPKPSLVVVPRSLVFNWKQEATRFAPNLKVLDNTGSQRSKDLSALGQHHIILTTYGTLRNDIGLLKDMEFDYLVLDEAQAIKNASSESAKATRLLKGSHRLALSGTPVQNHMGDLWSLFDFINPGLLGTASVFSGAALRNPEEETRQLLAKALRPFILRRTKEQVAKDLPERLEQTLYCELEGEQRKLYDELKEHYRQSLLKTVAAQGINKSKIQILEALLRLRQAALHPGLIDKTRTGDASAKLDMLIPRIAEVTAEGHKALVFSQFTGMLAILKKKLAGTGIKYEYLDGKTRDRQERVDHFQKDPECKLFLISLKAGGLGLNLTAADYVFLLDPWWNPAVEAQAIDRAHRIGQVRQVFACRLIAKDTVEEKVMALQNTKRALADAIINAENSLIRTLGKEDLELLLS